MNFKDDHLTQVTTAEAGSQLDEAAATRSSATRSCASLLAPLMDQLPVTVTLVNAASGSSSSLMPVLYQNKHSLQYFGRTMSAADVGVDASCVDSPLLDVMKHLLSLEQDPEGTLAVRSSGRCSGGSVISFVNLE